MTVAIPAVTFPGGGTGRDTTGHHPASGLLVIMARPVAPAPGPGSQPGIVLLFQKISQDQVSVGLAG